MGYKKGNVLGRKDGQKRLANLLKTLFGSKIFRLCFEIDVPYIDDKYIDSLGANNWTTTKIRWIPSCAFILRLCIDLVSKVLYSEPLNLAIFMFLSSIACNKPVHRMQKTEASTQHFGLL